MERGGELGQETKDIVSGTCMADDSSVCCQEILTSQWRPGLDLLDPEASYRTELGVPKEGYDLITLQCNLMHKQN